MNTTIRTIVQAAAALLLMTLQPTGQQPNLGYDDTPMQPNGR